MQIKWLHQPGKWRLITDLFFPVSMMQYLLIYARYYVTVNEIAKAAISPGKGAQIARIDIKSAYRLIPVCAYGRKWLGMRWKDQKNKIYNNNNNNNNK